GGVGGGEVAAVGEAGIDSVDAVGRGRPAGEVERAVDIVKRSLVHVRERLGGVGPVIFVDEDARVLAWRSPRRIRHLGRAPRGGKGLDARHREDVVAARAGVEAAADGEAPGGETARAPGAYS